MPCDVHQCIFFVYLAGKHKKEVDIRNIQFKAKPFIILFLFSNYTQLCVFSKMRRLLDDPYYPEAKNEAPCLSPLACLLVSQCARRCLLKLRIRSPPFLTFLDRSKIMGATAFR